MVLRLWLVPELAAVLEMENFTDRDDYELFSEPER